MKILLQRVTHGAVRVNGETTGKIATGLVLLVGFGKDDSSSVITPMAQKIANMRIFPNEEGRFDKSLLDISGGALVVPQFTLYADTRKGRRPDFFDALDPKLAEVLVEEFTDALKKEGIENVQSGVFGAYMKVELENDGPVTIMVEV